jgi:hypothetical protein
MSTSKLDVALAHGGRVIFHIDSRPGHILVHHQVILDDGTAMDSDVVCKCKDANGVWHSTSKHCPGNSPLCDCSDPKNPKITC